MTTTDRHVDAVLQRIDLADLLRRGTAGYDMAEAARLGNLQADQLPDLTNDELAAWWNGSPIRDQHDAAMREAASPVVCPSWCARQHDQVVRPDTEDINHTAVLYEQDDVRVRLTQLWTPECGLDKVELEVYVGARDVLDFTNPELVRALARVLGGSEVCAAADALAAAQTESRR